MGLGVVGGGIRVGCCQEWEGVGGRGWGRWCECVGCGEWERDRCRVSVVMGACLGSWCQRGYGWGCRRCVGCGIGGRCGVCIWCWPWYEVVCDVTLLLSWVCCVVCGVYVTWRRVRCSLRDWTKRTHLVAPAGACFPVVGVMARLAVGLDGRLPSAS